MGLLLHGIPMRRAVSGAAVTLPPPERLILPMLRGEEPLVRPGQRVLLGQAVADGEDTLPLHAGVSGTVASVEHRIDGPGGTSRAVVIENDGLMERSPSVTPRAVLDDLEDGALLSLLYEAGIRLPDGVPLADAVSEAGPGLQALIVSAVDQEPGFCAEDSVVCYDGETALSGIRLLERLLRPRQIVLAVGTGQKRAAAALSRWAGGRIRVAAVPERYPYGHRRLLAEELGGVMPGQTAREAGVLVIPASAAAAAGRAAYEGLPAVDVLVCAVWGGGRAVYRVACGTPVRHLLRALGPVAGTLLLGGPMTGRALEDPDLPILQGFPGVTSVAPPKAQPVTACIRCGRCASVCPVDLLPWMSQVRGARPAWHGCLHCGACQYVCPARLPLQAALEGRQPAAVG